MHCMDIEHMHQRVKEQLAADRYEHTMRVTETAIELAKRFNVNVEEVKVAALLHDYAKNIDEQELKKYIIKFNLPEELLAYHAELWHGPVASKLVEEQFNINNEAILRAIYYHTTGRAQMGPVELVGFLADYIEPGRNFPAVHGVREEAKQDLSLAVRSALKHTIIFLLTKDATIHPDTFLAYNYLTKITGVK